MSWNGTHRKFVNALILFFYTAFIVGCSEGNPTAKSIKPAAMNFAQPPNIGGLARGEVKPPTIEEANAELAKQGENWLYGSGFGATTLNVATCIVFPPYILYLLGNAGLQMAGYEPVYLTDAVPEPAREEVAGVYDGVVSVPGRIAAVTAGEEFREK